MQDPPALTNKTGIEISRPLMEVSSTLQDTLLVVLEEHIKESGDVDYDALEKDKNWAIFLDDLLELNLITDLLTAPPRDCLVFFIQLYYVLRFHLTVVHRGVPKTKHEWEDFAGNYGYRVGVTKFTLAGIVSALRYGRLPQAVKEKSIFSKSDKKEPKQQAPMFRLPHDLRANFLFLHPSLESPPIVRLAFLLSTPPSSFAPSGGGEHAQP